MEESKCSNISNNFKVNGVTLPPNFPPFPLREPNYDLNIGNHWINHFFAVYSSSSYDESPSFHEEIIYIFTPNRNRKKWELELVNIRDVELYRLWTCRS